MSVGVLSAASVAPDTAQEARARHVRARSCAEMPVVVVGWLASMETV